MAIVLITFAALAVAWGYSANFFLPQSPYGEPVDIAYDRAGQEFAGEPWRPKIVTFYRDDVGLQIETSLAVENGRTCNRIYERVWEQPYFLAEWHTGRLLIYGQDDLLVCGGKA